MTTICAAWQLSINGRSQDQRARRCDCFKQAIELDPQFASAYGMAAWCYVVRASRNGWVTDRGQDVAEAARLAQKAVELGKDDAVALAAGAHALAWVVQTLMPARCTTIARVSSTQTWRPRGFSAGWLRVCAASRPCDQALCAIQAHEPA